MNDTTVTERETIVISYPAYEYELQAKMKETGLWEYWDASRTLEGALAVTRNPKMMITRYQYEWRIVRASDKRVMACKYVVQVQA